MPLLTFPLQLNQLAFWPQLELWPKFFISVATTLVEIRNMYLSS